MALLSSVFPPPQSAIPLFVLSLYHSTCHKRIRKQQECKSSTWKILATLKKALSLGFSLSLLDLPTTHRFFSLSIYFFILFSFLQSVYGLLVVFSGRSQSQPRYTHMVYVLPLTLP